MLRRTQHRLVLLLALAVVAAYLLIDVRGSWTFALRLRGWTILTMLLVGYAVAVSTVLLQTVTTNRILTPSIMGSDALYALLQTVFVAALGAASLTRGARRGAVRGRGRADDRLLAGAVPQAVRRARARPVPGVDHRRAVLWILVVVAVLVSMSTALVGPITFFGLLVANLAYRVVGTDRHAATLPAAVLLAVVALAGGQAVLQHGLGLDSTLSVVVEFLGGLVFLTMLVRRVRR